MHIGGLQKHSLIDFPGKISAVLFLCGCNFRCPYCHNPQLVAPPASEAQGLSIAAVEAFLEERRGLLEGVVLSGGEPTLQPGLPDLCRRLKAMGYAVKLDTNGSRPQVIRRLAAEGLVDYLAMDIKTDLERYAGWISRRCDAAAVAESIQRVMAAGVDYEFRTTCAAPLITPAVIEAIARRISGSRLFALQPFRAGRMLRPDFFEGVDPALPPAEMNALQRIAAPWVRRCLVR
jgi:pyruvate formate lyase activating enzyme